MCGVCGLVSLNGARVERQALEEMSGALVHRGPDSDGIFVDGQVGIAARRLAIIDLAGGDQPIANEDGSIHVVQNGEIYNYRELRRELESRGHRFGTQSDTEVLVHLYEEHGLGFAERLRGMFAIAIWDARARQLVLARDRFGIKPLYYRAHEGSLSFASELKALLRTPGFSRDVDLDALDAFLAFGFVPAPLTIFREARKLQPGTLLTWQEGEGASVRLVRYAGRGPAHAAEVRTESADALAAELRERLRDSVRAHLVADVPVGVLLSGGIDSATLVALAAEAASEPVRTFTVGFEERHFDERAAARLVAERYGTDHHEIVMRPDAVSLLPAMADIFDEPFADASAIPAFLVSRLAREEVKVALSGEGGDELFGGYNYYVGHRLAPVLGRVASLARPLVERLPSSSAKASTLDWRAKRFVRSAEQPALRRHYAWKTYIPPDERAALLLPSRRGMADPFDLLSEQYAESKGRDELSRVMDIDIGLFLVDDMLVKTDRVSMANSLEVRVPMLDPVVAELALALPSELKVRGLAKKRLLKKAVEPLVPPEIIRGEKKGFAIPLAAWLRNELEPFARDVLSTENLRRQGFFDPQAVGRLLENHVSGRADEGRKLWALLNFCLWHDRFGSPSAGP
ncbi:MAG TPA: asparagine synthase (glutamine-hydrolyzing) [Gaiellaceae bacterium]|jgi:asparagine synthase (glutamine-hydrolysing)|nr:asparagine synthase (glutamine-hydrolyzing) [Gaiellaceae bacterium]